MSKFYTYFLSLFIGCVILNQSISAQVSTNYVFTTATSTFTPITGGTLYGSTTSDDQRYVNPTVTAGATTAAGVGIPIGFNFSFNSETFNLIAFNTNGFLSFGRAGLAISNVHNNHSAYTPISTTLTTVFNAPQHRMGVAGFARDLQGQTGSSLRLETIGTAPNRVCVVQWLGFRRFGATGDNLNFQIRLYETTNVIEVAYGAMATTNTSTTTGAHVGLMGGGGLTAIDFNSRTVGTAQTWPTSIASAVASGFCIFTATNIASNGLVYRWAPNPCIAPGIVMRNITPTAATLGWTLNANATGGYEVEYRATGTTTWTSAGTTTRDSIRLTGLTALTSYEFHIRAICAGPLAGPWGFTGSFSTLCASRTCTFTMRLWDSFGDGWNGNNLELIQGGTVLANALSFTTGRSRVITTNLCEGSNVTVRYTRGSFATEIGWALEDPFGVVLDTVAFTTAPGTTTGQQIIRLSTPVSCTPPACIRPTQVSVGTVLDVSATINLTVPTNAVSAQVEYGVAGFVRGTGTTVTVPIVNRTATLTGLSPSTSYDVYLRNNCGTVDGYSAWVGPINFVTQCSPPVRGDILGDAIPITVLPATIYDSLYTPCVRNNPYSNVTAAGIERFYRVKTGRCAIGLIISTCGSDFDSRLVLLDSAGRTVLVTAFNECGVNERINRTVTPNTWYTIVVEANTTTLTKGRYTLTIAQIANNTFGRITKAIINPSCNGLADAQVTLTPQSFSPPLRVVWDDGVTTSRVRTGMSAGVYSFIASDACGVGMRDTVIITQASSLMAMASTFTDKVKAICFGETLTLGGTPTGSLGKGPYTYNWVAQPSLSATNISNPIASPTVTTWYKVSVTDACNAVTTDSVQIIVPQRLRVTSQGSNVACFGDNNGTATFDYTGGLPPHAFLWQTGETTRMLTGLTVGRYIYTITDNCNTKVTDTVIVIEPQTIATSVTNVSNTSCAGSINGTISLLTTGGTPPFAYLWSNRATTPNLSGIPSGVYTVSVTDSRGCTFTSPTAITITSPTAVSVSIQTSPAACNASASGSATASANGGTGPYFYTWSNGQTSRSISGLSAGTVSVQARDANGCVVSNSASAISQPIALNVTSTSTHVSGPTKNDGAASVTPSGGTAPYSYRWSSNPAQATATASGLPAGLVTCTITDANGCTVLASVVVSLELGFENASNLGKLTLTPNPTSDKAQVQINLNQMASVVELSVYNVLGQKLSTQVVKNTQIHSFEIDATQMQPGTYLLKLMANDQTATARLIVTH